ncbi:MAG: TolC family protein [Planctomycetota bacterium]
MRNTAFLVAAAVLLLSGCTPYYEGYERSADAEVLPLLEEAQRKVDTERAPETPEGVIEPKAAPEIEVSRLQAAEVAPEMLTLEECLALAFSNSRDFKRQKEALYLSVLGYTSVRHGFSWRPSGNISGDVTVDGNAADDTVTTADGDATLSLARQLLSGGSFTVSTGVSQNGTVSGPGTDSNSSSVSASFSHELLKGTGTAARESLVQAEREVRYATRDFELFRQRQAISTIRSYYDLLRRRQSLETSRAKLEQFRFLYARSEALFEKGKITAVDVFRAKQEMLRAGNDLSDDREAYNLELDRFKITLGLETDRNVDVADREISVPIISVNLSEAMATAFENRLDLMTATEQLEDSERSVEIARNAILPELRFTLSAGVSSDEDLLDYSADNGATTAGLFLELPLDRKNERNAYKGSLISLARARRTFALKEDTVKLEVRETVRNLRQVEVSLAIQTENVDLAVKRLEAAELDFKRGKVSNREIVEAQTELQDAKNALVQAQVDYLVATITLKRDIGTLRVDEKGGWW